MKWLLSVALLPLLLTSNSFAQTRIGEHHTTISIHALRFDSDDWELCQPDISAELTKAQIIIHTKMPQVYTVVQLLKRHTYKKDGEDLATWFCTDTKGIGCNVTLGTIATDELGEYIAIEYSDHFWIYRGYFD